MQLKNEVNKIRVMDFVINPNTGSLITLIIVQDFLIPIEKYWYELKEWDLFTGKIIRELLKTDETIKSINISQDGKYLLL